MQPTGWLSRNMIGKLGCVKIFDYFVHNPDLKVLNKLRTRIVFFLKLDNGKSGLSPWENSKNWWRIDDVIHDVRTFLFWEWGLQGISRVKIVLIPSVGKPRTKEFILNHEIDD